MLFWPLMLGGGILWATTYALIIKKGWEDRTYGMPIAALCANLSWEFIFVFVFPHGPLQLAVNATWLSLDLLILIQVFVFGPYEFPDLPPWAFRAMVVAGLALGFVVVFSVTVEFSDYQGAYAAFGQGALMSILFPYMLYVRRSLRGQSLAIALCKLFGSGLIVVAFWLYEPIVEGSILLVSLFICSTIFDALYSYLVWLTDRSNLFGATTR